MIAAALAAAAALAGCSAQSVTYDPGASSSEAALPTATAAATTSPTAAPTSAAADVPAVTATAAPTVTAAPTATPTPTIVPITPIEITPTVNPDQGLKLIGEKAEGDSIFKARIVNKSNFTIPWFSLKDSFTDYYPKNMLETSGSGDIQKDEKRVLYFNASHGLKESAEREERAQYDIRLAFKTDEEMKDADSEGHYYVLHDIPFSDLEEFEICFNTDTSVPYIKYKSKKTGQEVSTEKAETALYEEDREENSGDTETDANRTENGTADTQTQTETQTQSDTQTDNQEENRENTETAEEEDTIVEIREDEEDGGDEDEEEYIDYEDNDEIIYYNEDDAAAAGVVG